MGFLWGSVAVSQCCGISVGLAEAPDSASTDRIRDRDSKFPNAFDEVFTWNGARIITTPAWSSRANSYAERFVGTHRRECLDRLLIIGGRHLRQILAECARHYNSHRPH